MHYFTPLLVLTLPLLLTSCLDVQPSRALSSVIPNPTYPEIPPFNFIDIDFSPNSKHNDLLIFKWDGEAAGNTYDICLEDKTQPNNCQSIAQGTGVNQLEARLPSLLRDFPRNIFVLASNKGGGFSSTPLKLDEIMLLKMIQFIKSSNPDAQDQFGSSIAISQDGNTLVVSAPFEDSSVGGVNSPSAQDKNDKKESGAVYVFKRTRLGWEQSAYIKSEYPDTNDSFGKSVDISANGQTIAVGASLEASNSIGVNGDQNNNLARNAGAAYIFEFENENWHQQAYLKASNTGVGDNFGISVSLSADGNTLAVGAESEESNATGVDGLQSDNGAPDSGAVYMFTRNLKTWKQTAYIKASNTQTSDNFGSVVTLSSKGNTLAVSATAESSGKPNDETDNSAPYAGAVYLFRLDNKWTQIAYIKPSNPGAGDIFGRSLSLDSTGSQLAVGSFQEDSDSTGINGAQNENSQDSGAAYIFHAVGGQWEQNTFLKASNAQTNDNFGTAISFNDAGTVLVVGASGESSNATGINGDQLNNSNSKSGAAYQFEKIDGHWKSTLYIKSSHSNVGDNFGDKLTLSGNGNVLAVSAWGEKSSGSGINSTQIDTRAPSSGAVYVY